MYDVLVLGDPARTLIHIDAWVKGPRHRVAACPVCGDPVDLKADKSLKVNAHFAHKKNSGCPLTAKAGKAFEQFTRTARTSAAEAMKVKQYAIDHIESIYYRANTLCPDLLWKEFFCLLEAATEHNIWAFKDFHPGYLPYVLLCCQPMFPGKRGSDRPHPIFFVLEPEASQAEFWHRPAASKQRIWRVDATTGVCDVIQMTTTEADPWYLRRAKAILNVP